MSFFIVLFALSISLMPSVFSTDAAGVAISDEHLARHADSSLTTIPTKQERVAFTLEALKSFGPDRDKRAALPVLTPEKVPTAKVALVYERAILASLLQQKKNALEGGRPESEVTGIEQHIEAAKVRYESLVDAFRSRANAVNQSITTDEAAKLKEWLSNKGGSVGSLEREILGQPEDQSKKSVELDPYDQLKRFQQTPAWRKMLEKVSVLQPRGLDHGIDPGKSKLEMVLGKNAKTKASAIALATVLAAAAADHAIRGDKSIAAKIKARLTEFFQADDSDDEGLETEDAQVGDQVSSEDVIFDETASTPRDPNTKQTVTLKAVPVEESVSQDDVENAWQSLKDEQ